jgi:hypothetical protein
MRDQKVVAAVHWCACFPIPTGSICCGPSFWTVPFIERVRRLSHKNFPNIGFPYAVSALGPIGRAPDFGTFDEDGTRSPLLLKASRIIRAMWVCTRRSLAVRNRTR